MSFPAHRIQVVGCPLLDWSTSSQTKEVAGIVTCSEPVTSVVIKSEVVKKLKVWLCRCVKKIVCCSNHMCGRKEMFSELDETFASEVKFGNNSKVPVMGKGKISISLNDGSKNTISEVLFVPSLHQNLLNMGQLSEKGYDMRIYRGVCTINDEQKGLIAKGCWDWSCNKGSSLDIDVDLDEIDSHPRDDPVLTPVAPPSPVNPHLAESSCCPQRE
ncbi:hypothetical protein LWI28_023326 [Acer negundo]|uniref:Retrovirus-related Pol polyprotein from transposon TNT 1-94-like beta-barrel domain-containing protein n=1 Tax=Acer negundo TaxID=4023 RepID=A0AAD5JEC8_ACENE|nr:hypothetical protein LWI28_023326 [Acer negundo]